MAVRNIESVQVYGRLFSYWVDEVSNLCIICKTKDTCEFVHVRTIMFFLTSCALTNKEAGSEEENGYISID